MTTDHFWIEKSKDGLLFEPYKTIKASGTGGNTYTMFDPDYFKGINYYRLKIVDADGKYTYSDVINIKVSSSLSAVVSPNPATDILNVQLSKNTITGTSIRIIDMQGSILTNQYFPPTGNSISLAVGSLAHGEYILSLTSLDETCFFKFIKN